MTTKPSAAQLRELTFAIDHRDGEVCGRQNTIDAMLRNGWIVERETPNRFHKAGYFVTDVGRRAAGRMSGTPAARRTYDGRTLTELRRYAAEYKIPGRTRMTGDELLTAVQGMWRAEREAKEAAVIKSATQGARLRFATHPGCVIVVTSSRVHVNHHLDGPLYVRGEYVAVCDICAAGRPPEVALRLANRDASTYRFYLHSLEAVPSDDDPAKAQRRADATGIAQLSGGPSVARTVTEAILAGDDDTLSGLMAAADPYHRAPAIEPKAHHDSIDEIEFPRAVCVNTQPHGKHRIAGTWRDECPGLEDEVWGLPAEAEPRCEDPECGEPLALIESGAVGHSGPTCGPDPAPTCCVRARVDHSQNREINHYTGCRNYQGSLPRPPLDGGHPDDTTDVPGEVYHRAAEMVREHKAAHAGCYPPTVRHAGSNSERQSVGLPGHCSVCAIVGHLAAHPERGCGDVGCDDPHADPQPAATAPYVADVGAGYTGPGLTARRGYGRASDHLAGYAGRTYALVPTTVGADLRVGSVVVDPDGEHRITRLTEYPGRYRDGHARRAYTDDGWSHTYADREPVRVAVIA